MKTQKADPPGGPTPSSPTPHQRMSGFSLRGQKKEGLIRGKLRIRSMPGAFLVLGIMVVLVGTALAVAGYWPYRTHRSQLLGVGQQGSGSVDGAGGGGGGGGGVSEPQSSGWSLGAKSLLTTANLIHSERMKLLGPVIMGVGLFILICANTVLYENRDRETQVLLAQMRSVICSVSAAVPSADLSDMAAANSMARHYQWVSSLPAAHLNILYLQQLASLEPLLQTTRDSRQEDRAADCTYQQATLQTEALHHQESASTPSLHSSHSNSCNSSKTDFNTQRAGGAGDPGVGGFSPDPQPAHLFKLNNYLVSASSLSLSTLGGDDWERSEVTATLPRRSHSLSYRTNPGPHGPQTVICLQEGAMRPRGPGADPEIVRAKPTRREPSSDACVNMVGCGGGGVEPPELTPVEEQRHRSWPRLDLGCARRYLKLDNKEDSVDRLLDQLEQQCSQWDNSFGSGPFQ
ncbi:transmembrane protein 200A-like [Coregonus clupeaformis]|uniref:transmembrane protein 200A-like n=1 Tax=Coregonus clupeaformis TaxID=59861 RepID=UPI001BE066F6|nr:transmembrane protein 200A-like [Coregonus clupeaformis]